MKNLLYIPVFLFFFLSCQKEENEDIISTRDITLDKDLSYDSTYLNFIINHGDEMSGNSGDIDSFVLAHRTKNNVPGTDSTGTQTDTSGTRQPVVETPDSTILPGQLNCKPSGPIETEPVTEEYRALAALNKGQLYVTGNESNLTETILKVLEEQVPPNSSTCVLFDGSAYMKKNIDEIQCNIDTIFSYFNEIDTLAVGHVSLLECDIPYGSWGYNPMNIFSIEIYKDCLNFDPIGGCPSSGILYHPIYNFVEYWYWSPTNKNVMLIITNNPNIGTKWKMYKSPENEKYNDPKSNKPYYAYDSIKAKITEKNLDLYIYPILAPK
jgi:hypothetical protein